MKKIILAFLLIATAIFAQNGNAQVNDHAIGLRFEGGSGFGSEISYQHGLSSKNRLEFDLGFGSNTDYNRFALTGLYQWVWGIQGGLKWYAGLGATIGDTSYKNRGNEMMIGIDGNVGIEYQFDIPLQLSLDFRPCIGNTKFDNTSFGLSVRYCF